MIKSVLTAGILAGGFALAGFVPSALAIPLPKTGASQSGVSESVILVRRGGGGGGGSGGFAMRGRSGGGGGLAMRSAGPRVGAIASNRSFNRGSFSAAPRALSSSRSATRSFGGGNKHGSQRHHGQKHRGGGFVYYGVPAYYAYSNSYFPDQCAWLYRNAIRTNSRYWWNRYEDCRDDYGY